MTEAHVTKAEELISGIIKGEVPRQVRVFAAQGLLPVSREDLFCLQAILSADPDPELAKLASESLKSVEEKTILGWIRNQPPDPLILDLLVRVRQEETIWAGVAAHDNVSDQTLRVLARNASPLVQDIIITNQVRLMGCLEILEDLRSNTHVTQVVLRRVREFEEEFIEKALADEAAGELGPSVEEALAALRRIGAHIPALDALPYPDSDDPGLAQALAAAGQSAHAKLLGMAVREKIIRALKGTREERAILVNSRNRLVARAVLACPKVNDLEVERYASSRSVSDDVIRAIAANPRWLRLYPVILALTLNPKTPIQTSLRLLSRLSAKDVTRVSRDRNVNPVVRRRAKDFHDRRR